jgi:hypothetical protein
MCRNNIDHIAEITDSFPIRSIAIQSTIEAKIEKVARDNRAYH